MKDISEVCFLIQARLNSERVPNKMIRPFNGSTLTDIALQKLVQSNAPNNQIYLSAHEPELIEIAQKYPINIFSRSYESANVDKGIQVLFEWWDKLPFKYVVMVSACNPLLKVETINQFIENFLQTEHNGMFSVISKKNYFWSNTGRLLNQWPEGQDLLNTKAVEPTYEAAHCLYASRMDLIGKGQWCGSWRKQNDPFLFEVNELESFDIDYEWQFNLAEQLYTTYSL
jgi:CMP-N-acetylneuraminic acid synthetase